MAKIDTKQIEENVGYLKDLVSTIENMYMSDIKILSFIYTIDKAYTKTNLPLEKNKKLKIKPPSIGENIDLSPQYTSRRCKKLKEIGLLEGKDTYYSLSSLGKNFIEGTADIQKIRKKYQES